MHGIASNQPIETSVSRNKHLCDSNLAASIPNVFSTSSVLFDIASDVLIPEHIGKVNYFTDFRKGRALQN